MTHTKLYLKTMRDDPAEQVIWNQERPIAYLNRADASIEEFVELENLIQSSPDMLEALELLVAYAKGDEDLLVDEPLLKGIEAIQKAKA